MSKWTVTLDDSEADRWDEQTRSIGKEIGVRTLPKSRVVRAAMQLLEDDPDTRSKVVDALKADPTG